jgi:hypothetical protein
VHVSASAHPAPSATPKRASDAPARRRGRLLSGGTDGNERLTAATGVLVIALLAVEGVTIVELRQLLSVHLFVGLALIPPIGVKLASTGYPDYGRRSRPLPGEGRAGRRLALGLALVAGIALALLLVPHYAPREHTFDR